MGLCHCTCRQVDPDIHKVLLFIHKETYRFPAIEVPQGWLVLHAVQTFSLADLPMKALPHFVVCVQSDDSRLLLRDRWGELTSFLAKRGIAYGLVVHPHAKAMKGETSSGNCGQICLEHDGLSDPAVCGISFKFRCCIEGESGRDEINRVLQEILQETTRGETHATDQSQDSLGFDAKILARFMRSSDRDGGLFNERWEPVATRRWAEKRK